MSNEKGLPSLVAVSGVGVLKTIGQQRSTVARVIRLSARAFMATSFVALAACSDNSSNPVDPVDPVEPVERRSVYGSDIFELHDGACAPDQVYVQEPLAEPMRIKAFEGKIETELVVRIRERCVPVWADDQWQMQTLKLRTYGFPRDPDTPITESDADDANSENIAWSAPGPTFLMSPASAPGAPDGTQFKMRLYNRMPHDADPHACDVRYKCNTKGENPGVNPETGQCYVDPDPELGGAVPYTPSQVVDGKVVEPPNCFHGNNSTNFHFHGFHVSPQLGQDFVGLELRPPVPEDAQESGSAMHSSHGESGSVEYGHSEFDVDPLRYTQAPGTHWYHAHKHGSTALQVLNGLVGTFEVRGEFDAQLEEYFETKGGGSLKDRLMVIQHIQEKPSGLGGADQVNSLLINGQANPLVTMKRGEIQRWRFVGATMQSSAALKVGFPQLEEGEVGPIIRQIAMDGVQFSPDNYVCQPFLNNPDCTIEPDTTSFDELSAFDLGPGNRIDILIKAPLEAGSHCLVHDITTVIKAKGQQKNRAVWALKAADAGGSCAKAGALGPLLTLIVEDDEEKDMSFPEGDEFPPMARFLADIPPVTDPSLVKNIHYQMVGQGQAQGSQFWINQAKYTPDCASETFILDRPERWVLLNNNSNVAHPFHIHQNPFQLLSMSNRTPNEFKFPVWRDTLPIPQAVTEGLEPNSNPHDEENLWGRAELVYEAKEFTGLFVNHCHILGHEDRGMMQNTQVACADGNWGLTGAVKAGAECDELGFCTSDCESGQTIEAAPVCDAPPAQMSNWPAAYGHSE
tara:strand:+ start:1092 stop:3488 length:2397 start_codon:yes stop_codon:yes gene_type:complete